MKYIKLFRSAGEKSEYEEKETPPILGMMNKPSIVYLNLGSKNKIYATYEVTSTEEPTYLLYLNGGGGGGAPASLLETSSLENSDNEYPILEMYIDGKNVGLRDSYIFDTLGEHKVEYVVKSSFIDASYMFFETPLKSIRVNESFRRNCVLTNIEAMFGRTLIDNVDFLSEVDYMNLQYEPALVYAECPNLKNVNIPANVTGLGAYTFTGCENIESINLTNNIHYIGDYSFVNCTSLTAITMPNEVEYLGEGILNNCKSLEGIYGGIASEDHRCIVREGTLVAFAPANLIEFTLTSDIINIPQGVFLGVTQGRIIIEDRIWIETDYDYEENWLYGTGFEEIIVPEDAEYLGQNVFCNCYNLKTFTIPNNIVEIGSYAFWECTSLQEITINENILYINDAVFGECSGHLILNNKYLIQNDFLSSGGGEEEASVVNEVEEGEEVVPDYEYNPSWLEESRFSEITINANVEYIGSGLLSNCETVETINIPESVLAIGNNAFSECYSLKNIILPPNLEYIGIGAFSYCESLTELNIPSGVTTIEPMAFAYCANLTEIEIPEGNEYIPEALFGACTSLTGITIPNSVVEIGPYAFADCTNLNTITIPGNVNYIYEEAFVMCKSLQNIRCYATTAPEVYDYTFRNIAPNGFLHVPVGADYSSWMSTDSYYLGYYNWQTTNLFEPTVCYDLQITADDVKGKETRTTIYWTCTADGIDPVTQTPLTNVTLTGKCYSDSFEQNTSKTDTVERTITFEYMGLSASTVIIQDIWRDNYYGYRYVYNPNNGTAPGNLGVSEYVNNPNIILGENSGNIYRLYIFYPTYNDFNDYKKTIEKVTLNGVDITNSLSEEYGSNLYYDYSSDKIETLEVLTYLKDDWYKIYDGSGQDIRLNINFGEYELILNNLDVTPITNMENMIYGWNYGSDGYNHGTQVLDISSWDTSNVYTMSNMMTQGEGPVDTLKKIILPPNFGSNCVNMGLVFWGVSGLKEINEENINVSNAETIYGIFEYCYSLESLDLSMWDTSKVQNMGQVFYECHSLKTLNINGWNTSNVTDMSYMFYNCHSLTDIDLSTWDTSNVTNMGGMFANCQSLTSLTITSNIDNVISVNGRYNNLFDGVYTEGIFHFNPAYNYDIILNELPDTWIAKPIYHDIQIIELTVISEPQLISSRKTSAIVEYQATYTGLTKDEEEITFTKVGRTETYDFGTNENEERKTVQAMIEVDGLTASCEIIQRGKNETVYTVNLNNQWQESTKPNPDSTLYDGVYESFSNKGVNGTAAIMYIDIVGYENFSLYIRSYAESSYDYVMVSQLDQTINNDSSYNNTTLVKAHTRRNQQYGTALSNYKLVEFTGIDGGEHRITVVYRKNSSQSSNDDRGYILIPKNQ